MAERRSARNKPDLTPDELAPAPDAQGSALTIVGVLGESSEPGDVRLFLDTRFETYYEIPRDAVVSRTRIPAERSPLGVDASVLAVRRGTELTVRRSTTRAVEDEFLAGDFTAAGTFAAAAEPPLHPPGAFRTVLCTLACTTGWLQVAPWLFAAPKPRPGPGSLLCTNTINFCLTDDLVCPPSAGRCNTIDPRGCPMTDVRTCPERAF